MSLLEVMGGMAVLAIVCSGVLAGFLQSRRLTEGSIRQNSAVIAAQGYMEQLKKIEFSALDKPVITLRFGQGDIQDDPVAISPLPRAEATQVVNHRTLDLNNTPGNERDDMSFDFVVYIEDLGDPAHQIGPARLITLIYTYEYRDGSGPARPITNTIECIRSNVL